MKKMHLICNAHIDPVWLWQKQEGMAEAISTFRVAADFCEQYENFVFNHNESLLYEWVEEHDPILFERIKKLVAKGKWVIMGGWYLQPDCNMPSGESFIFQIEEGRRYFKEKFGVEPKTAINFDPFGHSRGIVGLLNRFGYENYVFLRPMKFKDDFIWEGFDGSRVYAHNIKFGYSSGKGYAILKVKNTLEVDKGKEISACYWGIGNHGGGPSRIDFENINEFAKTSDVEFVHSTADDYFADIEKDNLEVIQSSLLPAQVGCYTTMVKIKQAHRRLENKIAVAEKIMSYTEIAEGKPFQSDELYKAKKALAFCQFHDILPGSCIKPVEQDSLATLGYGEEIADELYRKAFFALCKGEPKAKDGEIPILIFNPHPYEIVSEFELGFILAAQNWNEGEFTIGKVFDTDGNPLPTQNEKPECTFNLDWLKKISFVGKIAPSGITRFDCKLEVKKFADRPPLDSYGDLIVVENDKMYAAISKTTGLIERYVVDGKTLIEKSGILEVYSDNEDPWGMNVDSFKEFESQFALMTDVEANEFRGYPKEKFSNVQVIENGPVRIKVEALFKYRRTVAVVEYTIPKNNDYIDVHITLHSNEPMKMIKYHIDTKFSGAPYGDTVFGNQLLFDDEKEDIFQKWCGIKGKDSSLYVVNKGIYGGSFGKDFIKLSLLRTPMYSAHPIEDKQVAPHNRYINHVDMGEREFTFRITANEDVDRIAQYYNEEPRVISYFPDGSGVKPESPIKLEGRGIIMSSIRKVDKGYKITLYNTTDTNQSATLYFMNKTYTFEFSKYEIKQIIL